MKQLFIAICLALMVTCPVSVFAHSLEWDAVTENEDGSPATDLAGYKVYKIVGGVHNPTTPLATINQPAVIWSIVPHPLQGDTYVVTAFDILGNESADSDSAQYLLKAKAPTSLTISAAKLLSWTPPTQMTDNTNLTDLQGYNVYKTSGGRTKLNVALITGTSYTPASVANGDTFIVVAVNSAGESVDSNTATYLDTVKPKKPAGLIMMP